MDEISEILGTNDKNNRKYTNNKSGNYNNQNKVDWREKQKQDRQECYDTMDRGAENVRQDSNKFNEYLNIQSRFSKYSVGNCLIVLEKAKNSTHFKEKKAWKDKGVEVTEGVKGINILEPTWSNGRRYYNPKEVFDISQTNAPKEEKIINYDNRKLLEAMLYECNVPRESVERLSDGRIGTEYNKTKNILYVCKGMDRETLFQTLSQEMASIEMKDEEDSNIKDFRSYCVSYMICKRYGVDVSNYSFENLPEEISAKEKPQEVRAELEEIRKQFEKINNRMQGYFEMGNETKKQKVQER